MEVSDAGSEINSDWFDPVSIDDNLINIYICVKIRCNELEPNLLIRENGTRCFNRSNCNICFHLF